MTNDQLTKLSIDLTNWIPTQEVPKHYPQFNLTQLKALIWKRSERKGLSRCYKRVGKRGYINVKLFSLWMAGELPEQK